MLTYAQLDQKPQYLVNAVLAAEDRNFFNEGGISPAGIVRAAYEDTKGSDGSLQGGSTITQQFVRNYYSGIGTQQTFSRKIKEIFVAMKVGKEKSKQWILANYLNTIYLGEGAYGVEAAAETYYGKHGHAARRGAGRRDRRDDPAAEHVPAAPVPARAHSALALRAQRHGADGEPDRIAGRGDEVPGPGDYVPQSVGSNVWDPYVLYMVYNELTDVYHFSQSQIDDGGYTIRTTIDDAKMKALYQAVIENEAQIDASSVPLDPTYMHAGAVLEDPASGAIQALYPGPGYPGAKYNGIGQGHHQELLQEDRLRSQHGGVQPRAGRLLVQAVHPGDCGQAGHERADQHAGRLQHPSSRRTPNRRPTRAAAIAGRARPAGTRSTTTTRARTGRTRRRWRWPYRSTPPTPTCGTPWPAATA